ncbi:MAG: stage II sporulation protein R [Candidatus Carbobacillus sp.]|nr:stage II sporulation protein R [Candidatus Carbobacillus sp.]
MKRQTMIFVLIYMLLIVAHWPVWAQEKIPEAAIRLRIIAHSDHPLDQFIKGEIQKAVIQMLDEAIVQKKALVGLMNDESAEMETALIEEVIETHLKVLQSVIDRELARLQAGYHAKVTFDTIDFPAKTFGPHFYPAGPQKTLLIVLGEGSGHNLWCVLLPQFCLPKESIKRVEQNTSFPTTSYGQATSIQTEPVFNKTSTEDHQPSGIVFRFWIWDWLRSLWS